MFLKAIFGKALSFLMGKVFTKDLLLVFVSAVGKLLGFIFSKKGLITICILSVLAITFHFGKWWDSKKHQRIVSESDKKITILSLKIEALQHDTAMYHNMIGEHQKLHLKQRDSAIVLRNLLISCEKNSKKLAAKLDTTKKSNFLQKLFKGKK